MRARDFFASLAFAAATCAVACGGDSFSGGSSSDGGSDDGGTMPGNEAGGADAPLPPPRDATMPDAPAVDAPVAWCADAGMFPTFDKGCSTDINCAFHLHQIDCCGSKLAVGINHSQVTAFDTAENTWESICPATCACPSAIYAEDGKSTTSVANVKVACVGDAGPLKCMTYIP